MDPNRLKQMSSWMGFVGIILIIMGALQAIGGVFALVIGAIPGILVIILGVKLRGAKKYADNLVAEGVNDNYWTNFNMLVGNLNTFFKIQGILIIIGLVLGLLGIILSLVFGFVLFDQIDFFDQFNQFF